MSSVFYFFKEKTAYDMRISDWSSDVCSSDLRFPFVSGGALSHPNLLGKLARKIAGRIRLEIRLAHPFGADRRYASRHRRRAGVARRRDRVAALDRTDRADRKSTRLNSSH